jgi:DNA-binding PadR family transcriptional regulator
MFHDKKFREYRTLWWAGRESSFPKGDLKYVLLNLIKDKPRHGYELIREIEAQFYGFYKPSPGVIYPTLQMLEEMGYTKSSEQEGKKVYTITEAGLEFWKNKQDTTGMTGGEEKHPGRFKNIARIAMIVRQYRHLEKYLGRNFRRLDDDKTERIYNILSKAYHDIEAVLE